MISSRTTIILALVFTVFVMGILNYVASAFDELRVKMKSKTVSTYAPRHVPLPYPASRRETNISTHFGAQVADPYRWLEDGDSKEVQDWTKSQNKFTHEYLSKLPERDALLKRFKEIVYTPRLFPPAKYGKRYFYMKRDPSKEKELYCYREGLDGDEHILIDPNTFTKEDAVSLGDVSPNRDGSKVLFGKNPNNADESTLYLLDVATGKLSDIDKIEGAKYASPSWNPDGTGFYYTYLPMVPEEQIAERPSLADIRYHRLGTSQKEDVVMREKVGDARMFISCDLSRDGRWLMCNIQPNWSSNDVYMLDLEANPPAKGAPAKDAWKTFAAGTGFRYTVSAWRGFFFVYTNDGATRYRLLRTPIDKPERENWLEIIPERPDSLLNEVSFAGDKLMMVQLKDVLPHLEVLDLDGYAVDFPGQPKPEEPGTKQDAPETLSTPPAAPTAPAPAAPEAAPAPAPEGAAPQPATTPAATTEAAPEPAPAADPTAMVATDPSAPAGAPAAPAGPTDPTMGPPAPTSPDMPAAPAPGEEAPAAPTVPERKRGIGREIPMPGLGAISALSNEPEEDEFLLTFSSPTQPMTIYRGDAAKGELVEWKRTPCPADLSDYITEQVWFNSSGARVPMFVIRRKDLVKDGRTPFLLTAYGGFSDCSLPEFNGAWIPWLEAGGGCAIANIRGGGEFGESWHQAGMLKLKQRSFDDFTNAALTLDRLGYTRFARLAIEGSSNGGLLVGAAITQRPTYFQAAVCGVPLLDMVRYPLFGSGKTWVTEYGNPDDEAEFRALFRYSPYHQVRAGSTYPFTLFDSSANDDRVDPMHARKMAAAMQAFAPPYRHILLRVEGSAGHSGADALADRVATLADTYGFLMKHVGLKPLGMSTTPAPADHSTNATPKTPVSQ